MATHPFDTAGKPRRIALKVFAPAIRIVNRLRYLQKFILISACFAVPIAVTMYLLIEKNINYWEDFTRKEAEGVQYISGIRKLLEDVQTHRALSMLSAAGDKKAFDLLSSNEAEAEADIREMDGLVAKLPDGPAKEKWKFIRGGWRSLREKAGAAHGGWSALHPGLNFAVPNGRLNNRPPQARALPARELYGEHNALASDIKVLMEMAAYGDNLILDPDTEGFYLVNLLVKDLPRLTERIERLIATGAHVLSRKSLDAWEKEELIAESGAIEGSVETLKGELEILDAQKELKTSGALSEIKADINLIIIRSGNYPGLVDEKILHAKELDMPPWEFFDASTDFFQPIYRAYDTSEAELLRIFSARARGLRAESLLAWGATIVILTLVLYLMAGFYFSVTETVSRLGAATMQMKRAGLPEVITLPGRDELNEVVMFFNEVALALRRSHEVLLLSERLARVGSWDLDTATGTTQWSPEMYSIYRLDPSTAPPPSLELLYLKAHPEDARPVRERIQEGVKTGRLPLFEYRIMLDDGSVRHLSCEGEAHSYAPGTRYGMTGFVQDITDRKRAEEEIREALRKVKQLSGLLPICASCKKIRNDKGYWESIEKYIARHSEAEFSHSICDECAKKLYPDFRKKE